MQSTTLNDTIDTTKQMIGSAKDGTEHAVASARSTLFDGIRTAASVYATLRGFGFGDALGWVGLARRRSPLAVLGTFGAGVAVGAGVGMLFAPMSGAETRRAIFGLLKGVEKDAKSTIDKVEAGAKDLEGKAEDLAGKAKDAVVSAEHTVEKKLADGLDAAKDAVKGKIESATAAVKGSVDDAKAGMSHAEESRQANQGDHNRKPTTDPGHNHNHNHSVTHRHS